MSETFVEEVDREIANERVAHRSVLGVAILSAFRAFLLLATGVLVTLGLAANGITASWVFGIATVTAMAWLRGTKSTS